MKETETDDSLLQEIATLSSRGSSGRLQIRAGATRGAFFFSQGKLVDARMGPFTGLFAINLAVSLGETSQCFDPSIQPPHSSFNDSKERTLIKERFGIDTFESEVVAEQSGLTEERAPGFKPAAQPEGHEATFSREQVSAAEDCEIEPTSELTKPGGKPFYSSNTNQSPTYAGAVPSAVEYQTTVEGFVAHHPRDRFILRGFIILIVIPAAVVIASFWTEDRHTSSEFKASPAIKAEPALAPTPSQVAPATPAIKVVQAEPQTTIRKVAVPTDEGAKTLPVAVPERQPEAVKKAASDDTAIELSAADKASLRTVVVIVQISEGHVTEAYIQNPQVGLAASESTALRMARERRYPKDKKGTERVIFKIAGRQKL